MFVLETFQIGSVIQFFSVGSHITSHGLITQKLYSFSKVFILS